MSMLRKSARGQMCMVRSDQCNHNPETTVLAHMNGGGMGMKNPDIHGAFACSACHDVIDGRVNSGYSPDEVRLLHLDAIIRTQRYWMREGLLHVGKEGRFESKADCGDFS